MMGRAVMSKMSFCWVSLSYTCPHAVAIECALQSQQPQGWDGMLRLHLATLPVHTLKRQAPRTWSKVKLLGASPPLAPGLRSCGAAQGACMDTTHAARLEGHPGQATAQRARRPQAAPCRHTVIRPARTSMSTMRARPSCFSWELSGRQRTTTCVRGHRSTCRRVFEARRSCPHHCSADPCPAWGGARPRAPATAAASSARRCGAGAAAAAPPHMLHLDRLGCL